MKVITIYGRPGCGPCQLATTLIHREAGESWEIRYQNVDQLSETNVLAVRAALAGSSLPLIQFTDNGLYELVRGFVPAEIKKALA